MRKFHLDFFFFEKCSIYAQFLCRLILFAGVELCWNIYPSAFYSSLILLCIHLVILWGLWIAPVEPSYVEEDGFHTKK
jgi:alpha-1,3-mannosyltransferase